MALTDLTNPQLGTMTIRVRSARQSSGPDPVEYTRFLSYEYSENWLSASDEGSFELDERELSEADGAILKPGNVVQLVIDGNVQTAGILDSVESNVDSETGSVVRCEFRDFMSLIVDSQVDPRTRFKAGMTFADIARVCLEPFGITTVVTDNAANRNAITGRIYGTPTSSKGKPLKSYVLHEEKPYPNESVYDFCSRVFQRAGLWLRPTSTVGTCVLGGPDFNQPARYGLQHVYGPASSAASNNIARGHFQRSRKDQASIYYASGFGAGGDFAKSTLRSGIVNPLVDADNSAITKAYPSVALQSIAGFDNINNAFPPLIEGNAKPAFLYDAESHTKDQLDAYLRRELAVKMRKALTARYEFMGHTLNGQPVAVDSIVNVNDQRPTVRWNGPLWVLARRFSKSAKAGTRTTVECILPWSIQF